MKTRTATARHSALPRYVVLTSTVVAAVVLSPLGPVWASTTPSPDITAATLTDPSASPAAISPAPSDSPTSADPSATTSSPAPVASSPSAPAASSSAPAPVVTGPAAKPTAAPALAPAGVDVKAAATFASPHTGPYTTRSDECAACHRAHNGKSTALLSTAGAQSALCFTCHDGTGSNFDVAGQYSDPSIPANDPSTASYYSHPATVENAHVLSETNEFAGVLNRHTACSDCHNPHRATTGDSTSANPGDPWTPSGAIAGSSGVSVTYALGVPSYTFLDGVAQPITAEYQLCFKCHSGFTKLLAKDPAHPSRDMLDKAVEFDPAGVSFHPVEAAGRNQTPKMALSLSGSSPFKLWTFTPSDTVRCTNCHASAVSFPLAGTPDKGSDLPTHTSTYRGVLLQNYEDRVLKDRNQSFNVNDFALCFLCHTDSPFSTTNTSATNFSLHRKHVAEIAGEGSGGRSIDQAGDGRGNALCAECHFRPHSTATTADQNTRLVSFAPNVQPNNGTLAWTPQSTGRGTCTLTCHGVEHNAELYTP